MIAATVGSAVGLGTIWRFPAMTQANGGAAFLLIYVVCAFGLGVPLMLSEFALGRSTRSDAVGAFQKLAHGKLWWLVGAGAVLVSYIIMMYYMVVGGWTLEYLVESVTGNLYSGQHTPAHFTELMHNYVMTDWMPVIFTWIFIAMNIFVLLGGVQKGIERMANVMMPLLFVLLAIFCTVTLTMPGAGAGVEFFLHPDFSKITAEVVISALGQALFSLSLGMGILITYGAYYPERTPLTRTSVTVVSMTLVVALLTGLIIFPAVASTGLIDQGLSGTTLVFVTLPQVFAVLPCPQLWSILFFILLTVAALTSTVSISEVSIRLLQERTHCSRRTAVLWVLCPIFAFAAVCSLSFGALSGIKFCGMIIFDALDTLSNNYILPIVALGTCIYAGWFAPAELLRRQLTNNGTLRGRATALILFVIRWLAPPAIVAILVANII